MATTLIALGANLGDRRGNLQRAIALLARPPAQRVVAHSRWFSTAPIGGPAGQAEFVNAAARVETSLSPLELLAVLRDIEAELGRQQRERWAARCVDLDLLLFDDLILKTPELELPHPRMAFRRFVLEPAADVAADLLHPVIGWTIGQLLTHLNGGRTILPSRVCRASVKPSWLRPLRPRHRASLLPTPPPNVVVGGNHGGASSCGRTVALASAVGTPSPPTLDERKVQSHQ